MQERGNYIIIIYFFHYFFVWLGGSQLVIISRQSRCQQEYKLRVNTTEEIKQRLVESRELEYST